jgi:DNA-binding transcriptional regulator YhcF (GntR family)
MGLLGLRVNRNGDVPVATQLTWQIQALVVNGRLRPGEQLPSVRKLAEVVGVNVNTVRAVYERLEGEGFVVTQHGRGSFVAENVPQLDPGTVAARVQAGAGEPSRDELKEQIAALESHLSAQGAQSPPRRSGRAPRVLTNAELAKVRDDLVGRLEALDAVRYELVELLASLRIAMGEEGAPASAGGSAAAPAARPDAAPGTTS